MIQSYRPVYINGWSNLSPQATFASSAPSPPLTVDGAFLHAQEPTYKTLLPRQQLRRWSRIVRMGLATALQALERAYHPPLDAILSSTAWGCVRATEDFLETLTTHQERYVTPTAFIQSTHNTIAAQIALLLANTSYNMTYTQGAASFELALWDAFDLLQDRNHVLVSNTDALTPSLCKLLKRLSCATVARPMGEGAACFVLGKDPKPVSIARLVGVQLGYRMNADARHHAVASLFQTAGYETLDLILAPQIPSVEERALLGATPWMPYESWCGNYPTQSAFGLGIAVAALDDDPLAQQLFNHPTPLNRIGLYRQEKEHWSFLVLDKQGL